MACVWTQVSHPCQGIYSTTPGAHAGCLWEAMDSLLPAEQYLEAATWEKPAQVLPCSPLPRHRHWG